MNKNLIITLGLIAAISASTASAMANSTIYTDGIGRLHFLGKEDASNRAAKYNYSNSAEQDLTRKLYDEMQSGVVNDTSYDQHPVKNYENTFPDSRFGTTKYWRTKYSNGAENASVDVKNTAKGSATATKGASYSVNNYGSVVTDYNLPAGQTTNGKTKKKHWWNKNK